MFKSAFAAQILFMLSAAFAKASTLFLMMRLFNLSGPKSQSQTRSRSLYIVAVTILAVVGLWAILSIVAVSVQCSVGDFILADQGQCSHQVSLTMLEYIPILISMQFLRWQLITAFDVATECILVIVSIMIVWPVQLLLPLKCQVVLAFAFRLP